MIMFPVVVQLNPQDLCDTSTRVSSKGFIANDGFPRTLSGLHNCSCVLQPQLPTPGGVPITVSVMYAKLPEPQEGAEELWIEDQVNRVITLGWPCEHFINGAIAFNV